MRRAALLLSEINQIGASWLVASAPTNRHGLAVGVMGTACGQGVGGGFARPPLSMGCAHGAAYGGNVHGQSRLENHQSDVSFKSGLQARRRLMACLRTYRGQASLEGETPRQQERALRPSYRRGCAPPPLMQPKMTARRRGTAEFELYRRKNVFNDEIHKNFTTLVGKHFFMPLKPPHCPYMPRLAPRGRGG